MDLSLLRGHGRPRPPESGVTPLASVCNPAATPVRVTTKYHDMTSRNTRFSCRIGRRADKQGPRSPARNQAGIEKYATGTNSPQNKVPEENHAEDTPQGGLLTANTENPSEQTRKKRTRDEYKEIMEAYYTSTINPSETNTTVETYNIWRRQNPTKRTYLDANKLANVRRDIIKSKRLTDMELDEIKARVTQADITGSSEELPEAHEEAQIDTTITEGGEPTASEQNANSIDVDEKVQQMKADILIKLETVKNQPIGQRLSLPKIRTDLHVRDAINIANEAIKKIKEENNKPLTLTEINQIAYVTALIITEQIGQRPVRETTRKKKAPLWKVRMENNIRKKRSDLSILVEMEKGSRIKERKQKQMLKRYNIKNPADLATAKEVLKQQIQAKAQRIRRFEKRAKFFRQNKIFKQDAKKFYRELGKKRIDVTEPPTLYEVEEFWASIWENDKIHNENAEWIKRL